MSTPRFQLIVAIIPITEAALRALTSDYRTRQQYMETMADKAMRLRDALEVEAAKGMLEAHR